MIDNLKTYLGASADNYTDAQLKLFLKMAESEVRTYCNCPLNEALEFVAIQIAAFKLSRQDNLGLSAQSYSGVSESYTDGYPKEILDVLEQHKVKYIKTY